MGMAARIEMTVAEAISDESKMEAYERNVARLPKRVVVVDPPSTIESQADADLARWAMWTKDPSALGLPKLSVTETANTGGVMRGGVRPGSDMPDDVAKTDRAVASLGQRHRSILRRVIFLRYERGLSFEAMARELKDSVSQARATLRRAQRAVWRTTEATAR